MCMPMCMPMCSMQRTAYVEHFRTTARALHDRLTADCTARTKATEEPSRVCAPLSSRQAPVHHEPSRQDSQPSRLRACHHVVAHSTFVFNPRSLAVTARRPAAPTPTRSLPQSRRLAPRSKSCVAVDPSQRNVPAAARSVALPRPCVTAHVHTCPPGFSSAPAPPQRAPGGSGRLGVPGGERLGHWAPPRPCVLRAAASNVADLTASVSTQVPPMRRANAPVLARGIGRRGRGRPVSRCTPPVGATLQHQSKATASSLKAWAPSSE